MREAAGRRRLASLQLQQPALPPQPAAVAAERAVGADDAVTRHDDRHGVAAVGVTGGAHGRRAAGPRGDLRVREGLSIGRPRDPHPDRPLKRRAAQIQGRLEAAKLSAEVRRELGAQLLDVRARAGGGAGAVATRELPRYRRRGSAVEELEHADPGVAGDRDHPADGSVDRRRDELRRRPAVARPEHPGTRRAAPRGSCARPGPACRSRSAGLRSRRADRSRASSTRT